MQESGWPGALPRTGNQGLKRLQSVAPWFEVYQVSTGTFALLEPLHYEEVVSYLILGSERAVLLDTGMGIGNIQAEVERLTDVPVVVVNSHSHYDHVGDDHRFAEVWAFDDEGEVACIERGLTRAECALYLRPDSYLELPPGFDPAAYEIRPSPVTRRLRHLEAIQLGGRTLTVHHTPGHSPGSVCLLDSRDGLLFTGDTFYPGMLYAHDEESDFEAYLQSLKHLVGLLDQVSYLCPAHNEVCVRKEMLVHVLNALEWISVGQAAFETRGGIRIYRFQGFGVTLPHVAAVLGKE
jgi:glyoxylase-like metal-dependent hydrolase (beta-lactamase superfamily II)